MGAQKSERLRAMHCLEMVGPADLAQRPARKLSGGQSQRVAIARCLMQGPDMLLADEPAASLDPSAGEEVMAMFSALCQRQGLTLVYVSHDMDHAVKYADRIIGLRHGVIAMDKASQAVLPGDSVNSSSNQSTLPVKCRVVLAPTDHRQHRFHRCLCPDNLVTFRLRGFLRQPLRGCAVDVRSGFANGAAGHERRIAILAGDE